MMRILGFIVAVLLILFSIGWFCKANDVAMFGFFAPKEAAIERKVFEETKSYNDGMKQELENMFLEYQKADDNHKKAIRSVVFHRLAGYDEAKLPEHLRSWVKEMRDNATGSSDLKKSW